LRKTKIRRLELSCCGERNNQVKGTNGALEERMETLVEREIQIEDLRKHPAEAVNVLRDLLMNGAELLPDEKRAGFYELHHASTVYYIHISPVTGKILLLATWPVEAAAAASDGTA
jgi:hypothetical protein